MFGRKKKAKCEFESATNSCSLVERLKEVQNELAQIHKQSDSAVQFSRKQKRDILVASNDLGWHRFTNMLDNVNAEFDYVFIHTLSTSSQNLKSLGEYFISMSQAALRQEALNQEAAEIKKQLGIK